LLAWPLSSALARPLARLSVAARRMAAGQEPVFPDSRVPEIADHALALRAMAAQLGERFEALRRERGEARTLVDTLSDGVLAAGPDGTILAANATARWLLGFADDDVLPPLAELFHDKPARDLVRDVLAGREVNEAPLQMGDREVLVTARPLPAGGVTLVLRDVTALRRLESVRRDFVANVSHELKTPLTSIAGYAETLAAEPRLDAQARTFAGTILENARRMQRLVDELLDLSRVESGAWRPERRVVELEPAVREVWSGLAERAAAAGVRFETAIAPAAHAVAVDPEALRQILSNLLDNAVRHTPAGGRIEVSADITHSGVTIAVRDTGAGIPAEHLPRIFERFYRVDPGRSRDHGGTGLGLAIVKHLVEAHGGRVEAESAVGRGTAIRMTFPI
ncbi:MAG: sensor histidine kinase, partial [Gemmatimonadales bacterium]